MIRILRKPTKTYFRTLTHLLLKRWSKTCYNLTLHSNILFTNLILRTRAIKIQCFSITQSLLMGEKKSQDWGVSLMLLFGSLFTPLNRWQHSQEPTSFCAFILELVLNSCNTGLFQRWILWNSQEVLWVAKGTYLCN